MIPFRKMNGLGNDFVVVDARRHPLTLSADRIRALADRENGPGFDQFIVIEPAEAPSVATMRIINADGGEVEACGNAARCVAALLLDETGGPEVRIASAGGSLRAWRAEGANIAIDMGPPRFDAASIPLADGAGDPLALTFDEADLAAYGPAACVNVGNPHAVFFVPDIDVVPLTTVGPRFETHAAFPQRANISFATIDGPSSVRAVVWERGVGPTRACGTAACAIAAVGNRLGRLDPKVDVTLPGGTLSISLVDGRIVMSGPYALDWTGAITEGGYIRNPVPAAV
ncbi:diaminopimelate epimerase [Acuticoccus sp. M5D2P5]|uniref:diaminopimelate epimerase n=1 Tax=Acuticoccus kalidii TaxID=2910977 RepID=UPI001F263E48|nr:diaminopimelate epimerase [Acuticoccus kalidii]MCF3932125.1 diaminopimelate epimerase [Acuticoccus kalidii]